MNEKLKKNGIETNTHDTEYCKTLELSNSNVETTILCVFKEF